jgi:S1-C subfamily serine protease
MQYDRRDGPPSSISSVVWQVVLFLLLGLFAVVAWRFGANILANRRDTTGPVTERPVKVRTGLYEDEKKLVDLYKRVKPSVVHITTVSLKQNASTRNLLRMPKGTGSGFIWDPEGHIVTNYHVIEKADGAIVALDDGSRWSASLVGVAVDMDLAVLQIKAPAAKLLPIDIGESKNLQVGQSAYAIGNPFGLDQSLASGIVSALDREIESRAGVTIPGVIQTTTPINPGNSGGPLLDSEGRLIGVTTMILSPSGAWAGIGFALPVDQVNKTVTQIITAARQ